MVAETRRSKDLSRALAAFGGALKRALSFAGASGPPFQTMAACASRRSPRRSSL